MPLRRLRRACTVLLSSLILFGQTGIAQAAATDQDTAGFIAENGIRLEPSTYAGAFTYQYPLTLPPGRDGAKPAIGISYHSGNTQLDNTVGYGWSLDIPKIQRVNRYGSERLYTENEFTATFSGDLEEVSLTSGQYGVYGAKVDDGSFFHYTYNNNDSWTVKDTTGTVYTFGAVVGARMQNPQNAGQIFAWYLTSIEDKNNNLITYTYTKDQESVYLSTIQYSARAGVAGMFEITAAWEDRNDDANSWAAGFLVKTAKRLARLTVRVNGQEARRYAFAYGSGDNGVRSVLASITESGIEAGVTVTKPATRFTYTTGTRTWTEEGNFSFPFAIGNTGSSSLGVYVFDVNGDALPDIVKSTVAEKSVYINNGNKTWTADTAYTVPLAFVTPSGKDMGVRILDINNDGYQDLIYARTLSVGQDQMVYINNANGTGWTAHPEITIPINFTTDGGQDIGVRIFDVNGDALPDIVKSRGLSNGADVAVYTNNGNGTGWTQAVGYGVPIVFSTPTNRETGVRPVDINGDGLTDLVQSRMDTTGNLMQAVYINKGDGTGWVQDSGYTVPITFLTPSGKDYGSRLLDINGDHLLDILQSRLMASGATESRLYMNKGDGTGWIESVGFVAPIAFTSDGGLDLGVREDDLDGDLRVDILYSRADNAGTWTDRLFMANGESADVLSNITHDTGGSTEIAYTTSTALNSDLFFPLHTVASVTTRDGMGGVATKQYVYEEGDYFVGDGFHRKFAGFGKVTTVDAVGNQTVEYFHQGNEARIDRGEGADSEARIGRKYRTEVYGADGTLYQATVERWDEVSLGNDRSFVPRTQQVEMLYTPGSGHVDRATSWTYDNQTGNLLQEQRWGEVAAENDGIFTDIFGDDTVTTMTYANGVTGLTRFKKSERIDDANGQKKAETKWSYDSRTDGAVTRGNQTKEERWISGSTYATTTKTYDTYGFITTVTDPKNSVTTFTPDSARLYPATMRNALGHTTSYTYDYSAGQVSRQTDPNGFVIQTTYDGFDRPLTERRSEIVTPPNATLNAAKTFTYTDTTVPTVVRLTLHQNATVAKEIYTYRDGLGRNIQVREEGVGGKYDVTDTAYDVRGNISATSLPYSSTGTGWTAPSTTQSLYESFTYDPLSRVLTKTNADGVTVLTYEGRSVREVNPLQQQKTQTFNAHGQLTEVKEAATAPTTTRYTWDVLGNLLHMIDAAGNTRAFTYDGLGRRLAATDLHAAADTEFGIWTFTYDNAGNVLTEQNPEGVVTTSTYDALHRLLTKDANNTTTVESALSYDACTRGIGRVCTMTTGDGVVTARTYSITGAVASESKTIAGTAYVTSYTYDRQGNVVTLTYPDQSVARTTFDTAGDVSSVSFTDGRGGVATNVVSAIRYAPTGRVSSATYQNGVVTTWTYDPAELYRLRSLVSSKGVNRLQSFTYTYNDTGNITNLTDASTLYAGITTSYQYDDYSRLVNATATSTDATLAYAKTWTYDALGNILTADGTTYTYGGATAGSFANPHAVTAIDGSAYTYDKNGNIVSDGRWTNTWSAASQLLTSTDGTTTITYQYDTEGNRVMQDGSAAPVLYPNAAYTVEGTTIKRHIMAGALGSVATSTWNGTSATMTYHHKDHLGSTHVESDGTGGAVQQLLYTPFGTTLRDQRAGAYQNAQKYTGKEQDIDTGYYYYGARYYNPSIGRFLSQDPVFLGLSSQSAKLLTNPQYLNSYSYSLNNPINALDPDGRLPQFINSWNNAFDRYIAAPLFNILPVAGDIDAVTEMISGRDSATGQRLSGFERAITGAAILSPVGSGSTMRTGAHAIGDVANSVAPTVGRSLSSIRAGAVREAWRREADAVREFGEGTVQWTESQTRELLQSGRVSGYQGHHINSVNGNPDLAGDPRNIEFVSRQDHLGRHGGNWQNPTSGELIDR